MLKKKNKKYHLTDKEVELMELLWKQDKPLTSVEILAIPTIRTLLKLLTLLTFLRFYQFFI